MPQVAQQDYIYVDLGDSMEPNSISDDAKIQIANAIDHGCGLDIVLCLTINDKIRSRVNCAGKDNGNDYYIAYWNWDEDENAYLSFSKPEPEPEETE